MCSLSLIFTWWSAFFLVSAGFGLFLHWLGDSLDGALARFRLIERPMAGFLIDRGGDVLTFFILCAGLGLSPYLSPLASFCLFVVILLTMVNALLLNIVDRSQVLGFYGLGGTEGRLLGFVWVGAVHFAGYERKQFATTTTQWDIIAFGGLLVMLILLGSALIRRINDYSEQETVLSQPVAAKSSSDKMSIERHGALGVPILVAMSDTDKSKTPRMILRSAPNMARNRRRV